MRSSTRYRWSFRAALLTAVLTFFLILLGGVVHVTGSSLACPDWPLCYGEWMPEMKGHVLYEHGHRLTGALVGMLTITLVLLLWPAHPATAGWRRIKWGVVGSIVAFSALGVGILAPSSARQAEPAAVGELAHNIPLLISLAGLSLTGFAGILQGWRRGGAVPALGALGLLALVIFQGLLGGTTVVYRLPTLVSTAHLATSMLVFMTLIALAHQSRRSDGPPASVRAAEQSVAARRAFRLLAVAAAVVYIQIVLGALVRHTGSAAAAGVGPGFAFAGRDPISGALSLWPAGNPARLNMAHRYFALAVGLAVVICAARVYAGLAAAGVRGRGRCWLPIALVGAQVLIGLGMLAMELPHAMRIAHLGGAALLLASLIDLAAWLGGMKETGKAMEKT